MKDLIQQGKVRDRLNGVRATNGLHAGFHESEVLTAGRPGFD